MVMIKTDAPISIGLCSGVVDVDFDEKNEKNEDDEAEEQPKVLKTIVNERKLLLLDGVIEFKSSYK